VDTLSFKTISANSTTADKQWLLLDVDGMTLGRMASQVANLLRGKHKTNFTPHVDCGDNVIVVNASKIYLSGDKWKNKLYIRHTGYPGGQRSLSAEQLFKKDPIRIIENAVKGMLPKNKLGAVLYRNLKVFSGSEHTHQGQNPTEIKLNKIK
jgi:large subunit ribosomal protein L13|tara:strand:+ start:2074 stop:2529 length:456 start_codon:yes stop_codon:yes gene_type:complete